METLIGFVAGYLVGAREGRGGLERLKASLRAIASSPEARRMVGEAMSVAQPILQRASSSGLGNLGNLGGAVVRQVANRAGEASRAA